MGKKFKRILVANRGEIAIRIFRACKELGIRTVAIYSKEDKHSLFRTKADEAYLIGEKLGPVESYLAIEEIVKLAKKKGVDAIHPGYGFLSENDEFAKRCQEEGIVFIGPHYEIMQKMGDKISSKIVAKESGVATIPGSEHPIESIQEGLELARKCGYPIMLKASAGGGGRGMRIVRSEKDFQQAYSAAKQEAKKAFASDDVFIEKYLEEPKHIEVQILGDLHGNVVHLYERDCSIQRRHQKVIEFTPSLSLSEKQRQRICEDAVKIAKHVAYQNAGTVEFLVDKEGEHYFIEMNPRVQVEHTVTEMVTGIDIVQSQILIAEGYPLDSSKINIPSQEAIETRGYSIQCRVTTEDPQLGFAPDTGKIDVYRTSGGFGIRLDGGNGFTGAVVSPYYDSLLVKNTTWARTFEDAIRKQIRALKEMNVVGVKTNIDFLINVLNHEDFKFGVCDTHFIDQHQYLLDIKPKELVEEKLLSFLGHKAVNVTKGVKPTFDVPVVPSTSSFKSINGSKEILEKVGPRGLSEWIKEQPQLLLTDTTMRDAHQSLMATRMRTIDMKRIAKATNSLTSELFSVEMWGGATFDVAYRYLNECPWERLDSLRKRMPNVLLQMLIRGANGVGYKNYPDNVIKSLIQESARRGIDVFRIFDALNWEKGIQLAVEEVISCNKVAEATICYTGDILDVTRDKYSLDYYVKKAKAYEKMGAHIIGIKDMSALLKPYAAHKLISALKSEISLPIHLHTHDTTGNGVATLLMAAEAGVDIVDTAFSSMAGLTSQPALNAIVAALKNTKRDTGISLKEAEKIADYYKSVRPVYQQFETGLSSSSTEIYHYEIPGGQYSNLKPQVESFGLGHRFEDVKAMYKEVNTLLGDIVKVTPTSKVVGDLAIFMIQNDLRSDNILVKGKDLAFPDSVVAYFSGMMGQPTGGFPKELQKIVLKGQEAITVRPGSLLTPHDMEATRRELLALTDNVSDALVVSSALYPKVVSEYLKEKKEQGDFSKMGSDIFFYGLALGETAEIDMGNGVPFVVTLVNIGKLKDGHRRVEFEVNGNRREIAIKDIHVNSVLDSSTVDLVAQDDITSIGAPIPGKVIDILVKEGETVQKGDLLMIVEAMKMATNITAQRSGKIHSVCVLRDDEVIAKQRLITFHDE